jgi:hypothetical protein
MATPDTKNSIVVYKSGSYRGGTRRWSNRYHFEGALPTDQTAFETWADLIVASEKTVFTSDLEIVEVVCYDAATATSTNPHGDAVFVKSYTTAGTFAPASGEADAPGDCAALIRYSTDARSTKNHPVYLFNYMHNVVQEHATADLISPTQKTAYEAYADAWVTGFLLDGTHRERCGPRGAVSTGRFVDQYIRHRDFPS